MDSLQPPPTLASAAAVFYGRHGDVTSLARRRAVSRPKLYREARHAVRSLRTDHETPRLARRRRRLDDSQRPLQHLRRGLRYPGGLDLDRRARCVATAQAQGVSLSATHALLRVGLPQGTPCRAALGRLAPKAQQRAQAALEVLDAFSRPRARPIAADEIFAGPKPILMTLEQDSLCGLGGRRAPNRDGPEWAREREHLPAAQQVTADGGPGIPKGVELVNRQRSQAGQTPIDDQRDPFHALQRPRRAVRETRAQAAQTLKRAERLPKAYDRAQRQGVRRSPMQGRALNQAWARAEAAFDVGSARGESLRAVAAGLAVVHARGPTEHARPRRSGGAGGVSGAQRRGVGAGAGSVGSRGVYLPGSGTGASAVLAGRARLASGGVAGGGLASSSASVGGGPTAGAGVAGAVVSGERDVVLGGGSGSPGVVVGWGGVASGVAKQPSGGRAQQRAADAAVAAEADDARLVGSEARVLEPARVRGGEAEGDESVGSCGAGVAIRKLGGTDPQTARTTTPGTVRAQSSPMR